jgi:ring-1,2-phenylacetyl-CoA epoxidase subunit PaaC
VRSEWTKMVNEILTKATLTIPDNIMYFHTGGLKGVHTEHFGFLLAEMQYLPRTYPDAVW